MPVEPLAVADGVACVGGGPRVERLQRLVGLLQQVAAQANVGLLAVPRALLSQGPHQLVEPEDRRVHPVVDSIVEAVFSSVLGHSAGPSSAGGSRTTRN